MTPSPTLAPVLAWSGHLRRRLEALPDLAAWLETARQAPVTPARLAEWRDELAGMDDAAPLPVDACRMVLRKLRERVFCTLIARDLGGQAPLEEVVGAMTALADLAVAETYRSVASELAAVHGVPRDPATGLPQEMLIVGMGKLGGCELNVSSDIDLIMLYGEEGETDGPRRISHHEFYGRLTRRMMPVLSEVDANGQVFRTDLRLRPDGDAGPLAWSLDALEHYLIGQGREWERYAWLKARLMPARAFEGSDSALQARQLESLRVPFVYRKYFDFDALAALRAARAHPPGLAAPRQRAQRHRQRQQHQAGRRRHPRDRIRGPAGPADPRRTHAGPAAPRPARSAARRKRRRPAARSRRAAAGGRLPLPAPHRARAAVPRRRADPPAARRPALRAALAAALGMQAGEFEDTLAAHRAFVSRTFRNVFRLVGMGDAEEPAPAADAADKEEPDEQCELAGQIRQAFGDEADDLLRRADTLMGSHRVRSLPDASRRRVEALLPAALRAARQTPAPLQAAVRLFDLIETIAQRSAYLALLAEYPDTLARVARMVAASPWAAQYLTQHPLLLDSLIDWRTLFEPLDFGQIARQLAADLDACRLPDGDPDIERQMNLMRDVQRQASFQLLAQDLEGELTVEKLADQLSALADLLLAETIRRAWPLVNRLPGAEPRFAVIAYGKLGGKELGYASDLDLVFLFDDPRDDAAEVYAKLGRRMTSWLSTMTSSGRLYEIDLRLRPDGDAGLLAVSVEAFEQYQRKHAWSWEHQA